MQREAVSARPSYPHRRACIRAQRARGTCAHCDCSGGRCCGHRAPRSAAHACALSFGASRGLPANGAVFASLHGLPSSGVPSSDALSWARLRPAPPTPSGGTTSVGPWSWCLVFPWRRAHFLFLTTTSRQTTQALHSRVRSAAPLAGDGRPRRVRARPRGARASCGLHIRAQRAWRTETGRAVSVSVLCASVVWGHACAARSASGGLRVGTADTGGF